jgi:hypothetical protein
MLLLPLLLLLLLLLLQRHCYSQLLTIDTVISTRVDRKEGWDRFVHKMNLTSTTEKQRRGTEASRSRQGHFRPNAPPPTPANGQHHFNILSVRLLPFLKCLLVRVRIRLPIHKALFLTRTLILFFYMALPSISSVHHSRCSSLSHTHTHTHSLSLFLLLSRLLCSVCPLFLPRSP